MMRLRALRLSEVGRFSAPVAVEGFGDGLNVLSGPNELGKSTLLRALEALLTYEHKSTHAELRKLMPNVGGAPIIEADFEAEGRVWRLRKQFLSGRAASLLDVATGNLLRNADAEARLAAIKKANLDFDRFGLLWVRQGDFAAPTEGGGGVAALIAGEVEAMSLDARAREIHARIRKELFELQTEKTAKARGALLAAQTASKAANARLQVAEAGAKKQTERLDGLAKLCAERACLLAPEGVAARADTLEAARHRYVQAVEARNRRNEAVKELASASSAMQSAEREHRSLIDDIDTVSRLTGESAAAGEVIAALEQRREACDADLAHAQAAVEREAAILAGLDAELAAANEAERAYQAAVERDKLAERIRDVRAAAAAQDRARNDVATLAAVNEARMKTLCAAVAELASLEAALAAVVPEVSIALQPTGAGRISIDGKPLAGNTTLNPDTPLTIEIAGIGTITIAPNPATVSATQRAARESRRAEIESTLATLGAATLADAEARLTAKRVAENAVREAGVRLQALAPEGLDALVGEHAESSARAGTAIAGFDAAAVTTLKQGVEAQQRILDAARSKIKGVEAAQAKLREETVRAEAIESGRRDQLVALEAKHGDAAKRDAAGATLAVQLAAANANFRAAKLAADAWASTADADRVEALAADLAAAERAIKAAEDRRIALDQSIFGLERELSVGSDEDVETELENARAAAAEAAARLADMEAEVKALTMLDREFQAIADAGQRELSGPILKRIQPYLAQIFPDAALELGDKLAPARLVRNGQPEAHDQLSRGTQEQIAILVRLGLAHLLADRGAAVPLILDDALVYADDGRIALMFKALRDAARLHQVIVLNCREQTFSALANTPGATVLSFKPWAQTALAA